MTFQELIDKAAAIGKKLNSTNIPVIYNGISDNITNIELSQDNNGKYYINIY